MGVVVRCPGCKGAAQVGPEAVGLLVVCPRCNDPFVAVEDTPEPPKPKPPTGGTTRPARTRPVEPAPRPRRRHWAEPVAPPADKPTHTAPSLHDIPDLAPGGLPLSVMIGLALLPFAIPLVWTIAPLLFGHQPAMSLATPVVLAVAAAALCLAVVYTVDWSPMTRLKGVLMLVGLSYFAALSLFFLKQEMVHRVKHTFNPDKWADFSPPDRSYQVKLPVPLPKEQSREQPLRGWRLTCYTATRKSWTGEHTTFTVGVGRDAKRDGPDAEWFEDVGRTIARDAGLKEVEEGAAVSCQGHPGREWRILTPQAGVRIVRVYRIQGAVYYLAAASNTEDLDPETEELVQDQFFDSFTTQRFNQPPG